LQFGASIPARYRGFLFHPFAPARSPAKYRLPSGNMSIGQEPPARVGTCRDLGRLRAVLQRRAGDVSSHQGGKYRWTKPGRSHNNRKPEMRPSPDKTQGEQG
jgi:hypothetical protein